MDGSSHAKAKPTTFFFSLHRNARVCSFFFSPFDCLAVDSSILQACFFDLSLLFIYLFILPGRPCFFPISVLLASQSQQIMIHEVLASSTSS
jgi:hypothetical protein